MEKKHGPWTITRSDRKYRDEFIDVVVDQVIQPDGEPGQYSTVKVKHGVATLPIDDEGRVYLVRQFRYALGQESLEAATGGLEEGEDPLEAARRELKEELGIEAERWQKLGVIQLETSIVHCPMHLFVARGLRFREPEEEGTEALTQCRMTLEEAKAMVLHGEIAQAATSVLILRAVCEGAAGNSGRT